MNTTRKTSSNRPQSFGVVPWLLVGDQWCWLTQVSFSSNRLDFKTDPMRGAVDSERDADNCATACRKLFEESGQVIDMRHLAADLPAPDTDGLLHVQVELRGDASQSALVGRLLRQFDANVATLADHTATIGLALEAIADVDSLRRLHATDDDFKVRRASQLRNLLRQRSIDGALRAEYDPASMPKVLLMAPDADDCSGDQRQSWRGVLPTDADADAHASRQTACGDADRCAHGSDVHCSALCHYSPALLSIDAFEQLRCASLAGKLRLYPQDVSDVICRLGSAGKLRAQLERADAWQELRAVLGPRVAGRCSRHRVACRTCEKVSSAFFEID